MARSDGCTRGTSCRSASKTGLSRNTVSKWLHAPVNEAPKYRREPRPNKLSAFEAALRQALEADARRPKHERRTARALCTEIKAAGYTGGYSAVTDFVRVWRQGEGQSVNVTAYVPLSFELGEAFQFDWSEEGLVVGGIYYRAQVAHLKLCASRAFWLVAYRRMQAALSRQCVRLSEKVVQRLMRQERLVVAKTKRRRYGSYLGEISPAPENLLNRDFTAAAPNEKWLTDISEFQIAAGKVYLSPMIDCFDGQVVSWSIGTRPDAELVNTMLDAAIESITCNSQRPVVHSDRGAHYRWPGWLSRITDAKLIRSMSRKGCSPDNAACEGFFGRLKTEMFYPRDWQAASVEQFTQALDTYIRWYNEKRIKISLGALSPVEYRKSLGLMA